MLTHFVSRLRLNQLLLVYSIRWFVGTVRYWVLVKVLKRLRTLENFGPAVSQNTVTYNLTGLHDRAVQRSALLIRPLSVLSALAPVSTAKILTVGPRTEGELLYLFGHDFSSANVRGLDLISYSPWIDLGDMHQMPYPDNSFDAVILGWVIAYSEQPEVAAREVIRVLKPDGVVAVGVEYRPTSREELMALHQDHYVGARTRPRIQTVEQILAFFEPHVGQRYFTHDVPPALAAQPDNLMAIFSITK